MGCAGSSQAKGDGAFKALYIAHFSFCRFVILAIYFTNFDIHFLFESVLSVFAISTLLLFFICIGLGLSLIRVIFLNKIGGIWMGILV